VPLAQGLGRAFPLRGLLLPALLAGAIAGLAATLLQQIFLAPLILQAEALEMAAHLHDAADAGAARTAYTLLFNCLAMFGFALLLSACYALRGGVGWREGLLWGLAGFASFTLAPALGLPPELPGTQAAPLSTRQLWWLLATTATAAGLACMVFSRPLALRLLGMGLIVLPHLAGAPHALQTSAVPAEMARRFALGSVAISALVWLILGAATAASMRALMALRRTG
jgi:cobalt transporter subunit CbtA